MVDIGVTNQCQCHCPHCYAAVGERATGMDELSASEIRSVIDQISNMGAIEICFTGGEPLLRNDIVELVDYARKKKMVSKINTNGILLTDDMVRKLKGAGLNWCMVSIDHSGPAGHDSFRGHRGCYEKAMEGLRELVRQEIPSGITTVASREIIRNGVLELIVSLAHEVYGRNYQTEHPARW